MSFSVMVTGATIPLGIEFCRRLTADLDIDQVLAIGREPADEVDMGSASIHYQSVDLSRSRDAHDLLFGIASELNVRVIVHLSMHRTFHTRERRVHKYNVEALRTMLQLAERHPTIDRLVLRSHARVYQVEHYLPALVGEDHPLDLSPKAPQWIRHRVEADLVAATRTGLSEVEIVILRMAEMPVPEMGSQLYEYLEAPVCLRPLGFDPMWNLITPQDACRALLLATKHHGVIGPFNIPGGDTLPLSEIIRRFGRPQVPVPGPLLGPLYRLRHRVVGSDFSYHLNWGRLHFPCVLDGRRAARLLGYRPETSLWPAG